MKELIRKLFRRCKHRYIEVGFMDEMIRQDIMNVSMYGGVINAVNINDSCFYPLLSI